MDEQRLTFSSDDDFNELQDQDRTVELLGFVSSVESPTTVGNNQYHLFKFGLSNGTKKVMCLVWGRELIDKFESDITVNKILHIDGALCKQSKYPLILERNGFITVEIVIQKHTVVTSMGMHQVMPNAAPPTPPREVDFSNIMDAEGLIAIEGYVKQEFKSVQSQFQNSTFGTGSITDGIFKAAVHITHFNENFNITKGTAIRVVGVINNMTSAPLTITCKDCSCITEREGIPSLHLSQMLHANRTFRRSAPL